MSSINFIDKQTVITSEWLNHTNVNTYPLNGIKELLTVVPTAGLKCSVLGYYAGSSVGGGEFYWDSTRNVAEHNGGTVIANAALAAWDGSQQNLEAFLNWTGTGNGCWVKPLGFYITPLEFGAKYDNTSDDTHANEAANIFAKDQIGIFLLPEGTSICSFFNLYKGVKYSGIGIGQKTGGVGTTIKLKDGTNPTTGLVRKGTPDASGYIVENVVFDGNKAGNTLGHTLYIYQSESGGSLGGDKDDYSIFRNVWLKDAPQNNIHIDGVGTVSGTYYNPRALRMSEIVAVGANGYGWYANRFTDSDVDGVTLYGNKMGAMNWNSSANILLKKAKGFYNGQSLAVNGESFKFTEVKRSYLEVEAQEEYQAGILLENCTNIDADLFADACGYPSESSVYGVQLKNCDESDIRIRADSFHANDVVPFKQNQALYVNQNIDTTFLNITVNYQNQNVAPFYSFADGKSVGAVVLRENGVTRLFSSTAGTTGIAQQYIGLKPGSNRRTSLRHILGGGDSDNFFIDIEGGAATPKSINLFRNTNSTGNVFFQIFEGDGTSSATHRLNGNGSKNAELCMGGGGWNNGHLTLGQAKLWIDASGKLRMKTTAGAPTSDTDGVVVGTQS
jgi:hypothetical protein